MIKKYKQFNEGLLDKLQGPSKEEILKNLNLGTCKTLDECIEYLIENMELETGNWLDPDYNNAYSYIFNGNIILRLHTEDKKCFLNKHYFDTILNLFNIDDNDKINYLKNKLIDIDLITDKYSVVLINRMETL